MSRRPGQSRWSVLGFVAGAAIVIVLVMYRYLLPVASLSSGMDALGRRQLGAISVLVLTLVLLCLLAALYLIVRPGRFFLPRKTEDRRPTTYTDAWAESGRRVESPKDEEG